MAAHARAATTTGGGGGIRSFYERDSWHRKFFALKAKFPKEVYAQLLVEVDEEMRTLRLSLGLF